MYMSDGTPYALGRFVENNIGRTYTQIVYASLLNKYPYMRPNRSPVDLPWGVGNLIRPICRYFPSGASTVRAYLLDRSRYWCDLQCLVALDVARELENFVKSSSVPPAFLPSQILRGRCLCVWLKKFHRLASSLLHRSVLIE